MKNPWKIPFVDTQNLQYQTSQPSTNGPILGTVKKDDLPASKIMLIKEASGSFFCFMEKHRQQ